MNRVKTACSYCIPLILLLYGTCSLHALNPALSEEKTEEHPSIKSGSQATSLLAEFDFSSATDQSGTYTGTLHNGAVLVKYGPSDVLSLGDGNGYFNFSPAFGELIAALESFSVSSTLFIPESTPITANGNFIWTFANSDNMLSDANGNMFFSAISTRYAISKTGYSAESMVNARRPFTKGRWVTLTYTQQDSDGSIYIDSTLVASGTVTIRPAELDATSYNFLGRSCYRSDVYLKNALYDNFKIYSGALDRSQVIALCSDLPILNYMVDSVVVHEAVATLNIENADAIRSMISLPNQLGNGVSVEWKSSAPGIISPEGIVHRPASGEDPVEVTLTATLSRNGYSVTKSFKVTVLPLCTDSTAVETDLAGLTIGGNINNARSQLHLPHKTAEGSQILWSTDSPDYINAVGRILKLSPYGEGKKKAILTATATRGSASASRDFTVYIAEEENRSAYLFTYFTGNSQYEEQIRFALSNDGLHYTPLNNGNPVINSADIALKKAVRDPHILRGEDGETFYMVVTDMKSSEGWTSNRGIVLLKSNDLVNWTSSAIHFPTRWPAEWANVLRVWAPQTIYDPGAGKYMVYFSLLTSDGKCPYDQIHYAYANDDFTDLESVPQFLFDRGSATIDGDIVLNEADSLYHLFFKNEGTGGIAKVTSKTLTARDGAPPGSQWGESTGNLEQTSEAVEGVGVFRLINSDEWIMMYDCYGAGHYQFCSSSDLESFAYVLDNYSMDARHGTTMAISKEEAGRLAEAFPSAALSELTVGARNKNIRPEGITVNETAREITIPVYYGTDLTAFDPCFYATAGTQITPEGAPDFTSGPVSYSFTLNGTTKTYAVSPVIRVNPVLPGFHADPDILYSEKTGRFYIYPTTDGYPGWGGYSFDVFSSPDLVNWTNDGTILDLSGDQVPWATGNAWAPAIEERKISENDYIYYFYFSGESGGKKIGVAVSDHPAGPFHDSGTPMIDALPDGVSGGQIIDGDVFTDPLSGKSYFYWGNGFMAVSELEENMLNIKPASTDVITPQGGTLQTYAYREGTTVFCRNGTYYFLWSVDDTGSPNYHVAYGTSDSPTGPITVAGSPIVIRQETDSLIYGTGHNSVLQIPGRDEWFIVYHRVNRNYLDNGPGYHREVCIDRLRFNTNGSIQQVVPTHRGIDTILFSNDITGTVFPETRPDPSFDEWDIANTRYYSLSGQPVSPEALRHDPGIYIVVENYTNGRVRARKILSLNNRYYR
ncbi:MAG: family 43 glycosylhydrolase [Bacteroidales bacterium]|nr:family 43 glycosylhydrolase [Bacteroidales bacterium]